MYSAASSLLGELKEFHIKVEGRVGRDNATSTTGAVGVRRRASQHSAFANFHRQNPFIPATNHLANTNREVEFLRTVHHKTTRGKSGPNYNQPTFQDQTYLISPTRRVKFGPVHQRPDVVHLDLSSLGWIATGSLLHNFLSPSRLIGRNHHGHGKAKQRPKNRNVVHVPSKAETPRSVDKYRDVRGREGT